MQNNAAPDPSEFYKKCFEIENNLSRNILKAIPPGKLDYRSHERSPSTGQIAWAIVRGLYVRVDMVSQGFSHVIGDPHPAMAEMALRGYDPSPHCTTGLLPGATMDKVGQLPSGGRSYCPGRRGR